MEGIQLQLPAGNQLGGQNIQIAGLDMAMLSQTIQIDPALLQQLQQQGNINVTIDPNMVQTQSLQAANPNLIQNIQTQVS